MNVRNILNRQFVFNQFWTKFVLRPKSRLFSVKYLRRLCNTSASIPNAHRSQVFVKSLIPDSTNSWKWLLAISIVLASDRLKSIFDVINYGSVEDLKRFLKDNPKDVNKCHEFGWAPIHVASANNQHKQIEVLLTNGADANISEGYSGPFRVSKNLNINPADVVSVRNKHFSIPFNDMATVLGFTALHYAAVLSNTESLKVLINHGADPNIKSATGHRPIDMATDVEIFDLLKEYAKNYEVIKKRREAENRRRFPLEMRLKEKIVGQENAIKVVASAIRRKENGWIDDEHPLVFLFLGSSGIGKTELAKQVANYLHNNQDGFIRLDMSEYQHKHEVSKMIGSPPGYVGYDEGGQLTKHLTKNPNAVVLFDEVEKAHRDVLTVLLQLFDEGRLTDGKGKTIDCKNAIFIMTSNLASEVIAEHALLLRKEQLVENKLKENNQLSSKNLENHESGEEMFISRKFKDNVIKPILKRHFKRDEFLGRINEIVYFLPFSDTELKTIVQWELKYWQDLAMRKHKVKVEWDTAVEHVLIRAYDVSYGARSIKHEVERSVVAQLAKAHEKGLIKENSVVKVVADMSKGDNGIVFLKVLHKNKFVNVDDLVV